MGGEFKQPGIVEKIMVEGDSNVEYSPIIFWILTQNCGDCWIKLLMVAPTSSHYQQQMSSESFRESCTCTAWSYKLRDTGSHRRVIEMSTKFRLTTATVNSKVLDSIFDDLSQKRSDTYQPKYSGFYSKIETEGPIFHSDHWGMG